MNIKRIITTLACVGLASAIFAADQIYSTTFNTKVSTTKFIKSIELIIGPSPVIQTNVVDGVTNLVVVGIVTNVYQVAINWGSLTTDTNGTVYAAANGRDTLDRNAVWAAASSAWRTGMTNAWDGQVDGFSGRIITLWKTPSLINP